MQPNGSVFSLRNIMADLPRKIASRASSYQLLDDLCLYPGEIIGIYGQSGVGKTELIRLLIDGLPKNTQIKSKYIPQELPFYPELSLKSNIKALSDGQSIKTIIEAAPHLSAILKGREQWSVATLSGGEKRQLALVSVSCARPKLMIIDETFISLDLRRLMWSLSYLREEVEVGKVGCVLLISHDEHVLGCCDRVFELSLHEGKRILKASRIPGITNNVPYEHSPVIIDKERFKPAHLRYFFRFILGTFLAVLLLLFLLISPRIWGAQELAMVIPSISEVASTLIDRHVLIIKHGWWSFQNAAFALFGVLVLSSCFWFVSSLSNNVRRIASSTWIALQTVPVVLFSPLVVILWGYHGRMLEVAIALFIAVFPLGLIGVRALASTPPDILRAHQARNSWRRFTVGVRYSIGDIARGFVACAPLTAVGVIVAEYLIRQRGLGALVHRGLADNISFAPAYAYVLACVILASSLVSLAIFATLLILPRDITID